MSVEQACDCEARTSGTTTRPGRRQTETRPLETFNLEAPDELILQLVTSLDLDHDGALCLSEFVAGFKEGNRQGLQLRSPQTGVSSRRHFRRVPWNHPIHNAAEAIMPSNTLAFLGGS